MPLSERQQELLLASKGHSPQFIREVKRRGVMADIVSQLTKGIAISGVGTVTGIAELIGAKTLAASSRRGRENIEEFFGEAQTTAGKVAGVGGRIVGEAAQFLIPGGAAGKISKIPSVIKAVPRLAKFAQGATRGQRVLRDIALGIPVDAAIGAGLRPEESTASLLGLEGAAESPFGRAAVEATVGGVLGGAASAILGGAGKGARRVKDVKVDIDDVPLIPHAPAVGIQPEVRVAQYLKSVGVGFGRELRVPSDIEDSFVALFKRQDVLVQQFSEEGMTQSAAIGRAMKETLDEFVGMEIGLRRLMGSAPQDFVEAAPLAVAKATMQGFKKEVDAIVKAVPDDEIDKMARSVLSNREDFMLRSAERRWGKKRRTSKFASFVRAALISLPQTAARNITTAVGLRGASRMLEDGVYNALRASKGEIRWGDAVGAAMESTIKGFQGVAPGTRREFMKRLGEINPEKLKRLRKTASMDVAMADEKSKFGKVLRGLTVLNRAQELPGREIAYIGRFTDRVVSEGMIMERALLTPLDQLTKAETKILFGAAEDATRHALDAAVALGWHEMGPLPRAIGRVFNALPPELEVVLYPFARAAVNLQRFVWTRMPGFNPIYRKLVKAHGGVLPPKVIAQQIEGAVLLGSALALRESGIAGPKWYEIWTGKEDAEGNKLYFDARPYQPLAGFLYFAESARALAGAETQLEGRDAAEAFFGIRRFVSGNPLGLLMNLENIKTGEQFGASVERVAQQFLGILTRNPVFGIVRAIEAELDEEAGAFRDLTDEAGPLPRVFNEALSNIPFARQLLEPAPSAVRSEPRGSRAFPGAELVRLLGPSFKAKTPFEEKAAKLKLRPWTKTGLTLLDRLVDEQLGTLVEESKMDEIVTQPSFVALPSVEQKRVLGNIMSRWRNGLKQQVIAQNIEQITQALVDEVKGMTPDDARTKLERFRIPQELKARVLQLVAPAQQPQPGPTGANPQGLDQRSAQFVTSNIPKRASAPNVFGGIRP